MSRARKLGPEASLLRACCDLLTAERVFWLRMNTGTQVLEHKGKRRVFRAGRKGMADLLALPSKLQALTFACVRCGTKYERFPLGCTCGGKAQVRATTPTWLELKSARGVQSSAQKEFQAEVEAEGHVYLLIRDVSELQRLLKERA